MIPRERIRALTETQSRVLEWARAQAVRPDGQPIEELLNETLYFEKQRLQGEVAAPGRGADRAFWSTLSRTFARVSPLEQQRMLEQVIHRYADEIIGHFEPLMFELLKRHGAKTLTLLLNSMSPLRLLSTLTEAETLDDNLIVDGEVQALLALARVGTVVLVPTHVSNLDSVALGFALARLGLPPFLYGAGYNLFKNPFLSPFLRRLGAYSVDRQKKAPLYKQVLKAYATVALEMGHHQIFFPGGTRSRSGHIEQKLKKGLLGCGLAAYENSLRGRERRVFIVPCTSTYEMVLEAETLIEDYLAEAGKARYIIIDDESSRLDRVALFMRALLRHQTRVRLRIGRPLDPFGNIVLPSGESVDQHGRVIDIKGYFMSGGALTRDEQRNEEYTNTLAERLCDEYPRGNVVAPTHVSAFELFEMLREESPAIDLYRLLREGQPHPGFSVEQVRARLAARLAALRALKAAGALDLDETLAGESPDDVLSRALIHFTAYHARPAVERRGTRVFVRNRALLYYYRNRLDGYGLTAQDDAALAGERRELAP